MSVFNWFKKNRFKPTHIYLGRPVKILDQWYILNYSDDLFIKVIYESGDTDWAESIFLHELHYCGI